MNGGAVVGLVLAAGAGRRFGGPKALALLDGERLVDRAVRTLRGAGVERVIVVAGATPILDVDAEVATNVNWPSGMGGSLQTGLAACGDAAAAVVLLVDTPWVGSGAVERLVAAHRGGAVAAQATYHDEPGHPVLLSRETWPGVAAAARGDQGARGWLQANEQLVVRVPCDGTGDPRDVDRPEDLGESS